MKFDPRITLASSFLFTQDFKAQFIWSRGTRDNYGS